MIPAMGLSSTCTHKFRSKTALKVRSIRPQYYSQHYNDSYDNVAGHLVSIAGSIQNEYLQLSKIYIV